jgi:hypothetical protein
MVGGVSCAIVRDWEDEPMKGVRFYEELENKNRKGEKSQGNVIAIHAYQISIDGMYECLSATFYKPNSPVSVGGVSRKYLEEKCRRISETRAREIHPRLFERLDT